MWNVTRKGLLSRKYRLVLTSISVVLGVAFVAGTLVLSDTLKSVFDRLFAQTTQGVDAVVRSPLPFKGSSRESTPDRAPVPATLAGTVAAVPGVRAVEGSLTGYALVVGSNGKAVQNQAPTLGISWGPNTLSHALNIRSGHRPAEPTEVALDESTAKAAKVRLGDPVRVVFLSVPPQTFTVAGIFRFGDAGNLAGASLAAFEPTTAQRVMNRVGQWDVIDVAAARGVSPTQLRDRLNATLGAAQPGRFEAITGAQLAKEQSNDVKKGLSFFSTFLLIFALVAVFVGAFIIYNTFSIVVAQRARELGLLRALGASGRQVTASVALEALAVGLFSSLAGLGLGVLMAVALRSLLSAFGLDIPSGSLQVRTTTVVVALVVGTVVTFLSAMAPARRAARVRPLAALTEQTGAPSSGHRRYVVGGALSAVGAAALAVGLFGHIRSSDVPGGAGAVVGMAALLVFVGVAMLSPLIARPAAELLGWPSARLRGITGDLARENAMRNPRRTASTAAALMIGLALITFVSIFGASAKASFSRAVDRTSRADFVLSGKRFATFSPQAAQAVRSGLPGSTVVEFRTGQWEHAGQVHVLAGVSPDFGAIVDVKLRPGADLTAFRRGGVLVYKDAAKSNHWQVGSVIAMRFAKTGVQAVTVRGIYTDNRGLGVNFNQYLLSLPDYEANFTDQSDTGAAVRDPAGVSVAKARSSVEGALAAYPNVDAKDQAQAKADQLRQLTQIINLMYALLLLAVLIALVGIVNTLALSILERTRELGLLRAVGMSRRQMKVMVRTEAVIVSVFGTLLGLVIGLGFGRAMVSALSADRIAFSVPVRTLLVFVVASGLAGLGAGWLPARRAARLEVLKAIAVQ